MQRYSGIMQYSEVLNMQREMQIFQVVHQNFQFTPVSPRIFSEIPVFFGKTTADKQKGQNPIYLKMEENAGH